MSGEEVIIRLAEPHAPASLLLVQHLWDDLGTLYAENQGPCVFQPEDVSGPGTAFVIAWQGEQPVGCGAIRPLEPGVAEVKRMFVERAARGHGLARRILAELETHARRLGYHALKLETGLRQPEAIRLYEKAGFQPIPCYGRYQDDPLSVCYEKRLGTS